MFDLEQSIAEWRRQMLVAGIQAPVPLDELESHLRDEIERLIQAGHAEQTAFNFAIQEIGPMAALRNEFGKVEPAGGSRRQTAFVEIIFLSGTVLIPLVTGVQAFFFKDGVFSAMTVGQQTSILVAAVVFSVLAWGIRLGFGTFPRLRTNRVRDAIFVPALLLVIAGLLILPHCDFSEGTRAVAFLWMFAPFGILIGWGWGFATAARKRAEPADLSAGQG